MMTEEVVPAKRGIFSLDRNRFYLFFLSLFCVPLIAFYGFPGKFFIVFLFTFFGLWILLRAFEKKMQATVAKLVKQKMELVASSQEKEKTNFLMESARKIEELKQLTEDLREENEKKSCEYEETIGQKDILLKEYQQTIFEQRNLLEKSKKMIQKLESRVNDLTYEVRSLLQIDETNFSPIEPLPQPKQIVRSKKVPPSIYDFALTLRKFITMAESYKSSQSDRFSKVSFDSLFIDHRPFMEALHEQSSLALFIYSLTEEKMVFINNGVKNQLNIGPEKFIKEFPSLISKGRVEFEKALSRIQETKEEQVRLSMRTNSQEEILGDCLLGLIEKGTFANHVIGILTF